LFGLCISPAVARAAMKIAWVSEIELFVDLDALRVAISDLMLPVRPFARSPVRPFARRSCGRAVASACEGHAGPCP